jgi:polynucleotide 5'-hydroxyl-kinase GRC3/NOL9
MQQPFILSNPPDSWKAVAEAANHGHTLIVIGETDTGKSALCRYVAKYAVEQRLYVGYVDADIGQSEIGPPTTLGLKILRDSFDEFASPPDALYFVGATSPSYAVADVVVGVRRLADFAQTRGVDLVIVDTTGFVSGPIAYQLKTQKIETLRPALVAAVDASTASTTLNPILTRFEDQTDVQIIRLARDPAVQTKSPNVRRNYRNECFNRYFSDLEQVVVSLDDVIVFGDVVCHSEVSAEMLYDTAVGIVNERGFTDAVGILRELDTSSRKVRLAIPSSFNGAIRRIHLSRFRPYQP